MADTTRLIQSRYRLLDMIGRGGMGEVWRARDESLGRQVAVKCLKPMGPQHDQAFTRILRERFRREARVAAALQHRGVTVVHDFGESDGVLYLVMELLEGRNLSQLLEDNKQHPCPWPTSWTSRNRSPTPSATPTSRASCTATSSPRTSCAWTTGP